MSKLETNTIDTLSGTTNLTIGSTNSSTVTFENGAVTGHMYPAFQIGLSANQNLTSGTLTKAQFDTEIYDIGGYYDNSTNYRYTPLVAGNYYFYINIGCNTGAPSNLSTWHLHLYKNGSTYKRTHSNFTNNNNYYDTAQLNVVVPLDGVDDYVEFYVSISDSSGNPYLQPGDYSVIGGYRIGA